MKYSAYKTDEYCRNCGEEVYPVYNFTTWGRLETVKMECKKCGINDIVLGKDWKASGKYAPEKFQIPIPNSWYNKRR